MNEVTEAQSRVLAALADGPQQAHEIAEGLGVHASAVRRHLHALQACGLVIAEDQIHGRGRPKRKYRLTERGEETFPRDYALLLRLLIEKVEHRHGRDGLERLLESIAADVAESVDALTRWTDRLDALVSRYNALGFDARLVREGRDLYLEQRNCPFLRIARSDPDALCRTLDEGIMRRALPGADVTLQCTMAERDGHCRHRIRAPP